MEHHPYFHVSSGSIDSEETQAHEAAHGWYGDGVRIACWEDFVLSEGTTTYLAARALHEVGGPSISNEVWRDYECQLVSSCQSRNTAAYPIDPNRRTCNQIDLLHHPLWSGVPYYKGAFFYRRVAELVSAEWLDAKLSSFYLRHKNQAASMDDMIAHLKVGRNRSQARRIDALAQTWLRNVACPAEVASMCR